MSVVERRERTETWVEHVVPVGPHGAAWGDVAEALTMSAADYKRIHGIPPAATLPSDDVLRLFVTDDQIIVRYEVTP